MTCSAGKRADGMQFFHDERIMAPVCFDRFTWLTAGCTTRHFGWNESPGIIRTAFEIAGARPRIAARGEQVHGTATAVVGSEKNAESATAEGVITIPGVDAIVTTEAGVGIAVVTADCVPVFLVEPEKRLIGLAHAGWKGVMGEIAKVALEMMCDHGAAREKIRAWICPAIGPCCYEVSSDLAAKFADTFPEAGDCVKGRYVDLPGLNYFHLVKAGLLPENVHLERFCTKCRVDACFSYRAEGDAAGRMISFMMRGEGER